MTRGGRVQTNFYRKISCGPLSMPQKYLNIISQTFSVFFFVVFFNFFYLFFGGGPMKILTSSGGSEKNINSM